MSGVVFILGLVMIVLSLVNGDGVGEATDDSAGDNSISIDVGNRDVSGVDSTDIAGFADFSPSTSTAQFSSSQIPQGTPNAAPANSGPASSGSSGGAPPLATSASPPPASPTTFASSGQPAPTSPGLPGFGLPSRDSYAPPTSAAVWLSVAPPNTCSTFLECAEKLYANWVSGAVCFEDGFSDAYATRAVVDAMTAYCGRYQGNWSPSLVPGAGRYQLAGTSDRTSTPRVIIFSQVPGQTDPIVRSVQFN